MDTSLFDAASDFLGEHRDREELAAWVSARAPWYSDLGAFLDAFAGSAAHAFLDKRLGFRHASDALNTMYGAAHFDTPAAFWDVYEAFEAYERLAEPDDGARAEMAWRRHFAV